jgi:hypothetical protein
MTARDERVRAFLDDYGAALGSGDLAAIVKGWGIPSFVVVDGGSQPVTDSGQVEAFFRAGLAHYESQGIASTRANIEAIEWIAPHLVSVDVRWDNTDGMGSLRSSERWRYTLREGGEGLEIVVAIQRDAMG